jgi:hypothetical protein
MSGPTRRAIVVTVALVLLLLSGAAQFVDPDAWHSMSLAREALALGYMPLTDRFAYTPTLVPVVHHEWGTGMLLYFLAGHGGTWALQIARLLLVTILVFAAVRTARVRGAGPGVLALLAIPAIVMSWIGLTALRGQLVTLACLAVLLLALERDRTGRRDWIPFALMAGIVWQNMHAGFVVGIAFVAIRAAEQAIRQRSFVHLIAVASAMVLLVAVNVYGTSYYGYLARALVMPRPLIGEWQPIWRAHRVGFAVYLASVAIALAVVARIGPRRAESWPLLAVTAYMAASHERHVSIYALVWFTHVPGWATATPFGARIERLWTRPATLATQTAGLMLAAVAAALFVSNHPWRLTVPGTTADGAPAPYPVGPVAYLREQGVRANLLVPFGAGAYVSWKLAPAVKVSLDSRYESAYPPALLEEHIAFFQARDGWQATLDRYPTDLVLAQTTMPIAARLSTQSSWTIVYRDDAYVVFARPGFAALPFRDRRGERLAGTFP